MMDDDSRKLNQLTDANPRLIGEAATANSRSSTTEPNGGGQLLSGDTFTLDLVRRAKTAAMVGNSSIWRIRPMMISGRPYYGCVIHPYQVYDLQGSQQWELAMREAQVRGPENPLFTGALGIWNGVIIYSHDKVITGSDAGPGGDQQYASALFFGYQAGLWAQAQPAPDWIEKKFDCIIMVEPKRCEFGEAFAQC
jgi:N4-gp56 family major capsid protein